MISVSRAEETLHLTGIQLKRLKIVVFYNQMTKKDQFFYPG